MASSLRSSRMRCSDQRSVNKAAPRAPTARGRRACACTCAAMHPDAIKREEERLQRKAEREQMVKLERTGEWWRADTHSNVEHIDSPAVLDMLLAAHTVSGKPLVVHFYGQQCPGCKAMQPKLQQLMRSNGDFTFAKVDGSSEAMQARVVADDIPSFPYFVLHNHGTEQRRLTCNLTTIQKLRDALVETRLTKSRAAAATEEVVSVTEDVVSGVLEGAENILADAVGSATQTQGNSAGVQTVRPAM